MRQLAIIEKQESLTNLIAIDFLSSPNNVILLCNDDIESSEQNFVEYLDIVSEIILQREHEQQHRYFEKMFNKPNASLRFLMPYTPHFLKKYVYKHDFLTQRKLWAYLWPQYRKELMVNGKNRYSSFTYFLSIFLLPRITAFFAYALIIKTKAPLLIKRKLGLKFSDIEFEQALMHRVDFHDPDMIFCDSKKLESIAYKLNLCAVQPIENLCKNEKDI